jgi:hypothetical protein
LGAAWRRCVRETLVKQQRGDGIRGLVPCVVAGGDVMDFPVWIGLEPGAEFSEGSAVASSGAEDELAAGHTVDGTGEPDRLQERGEGMGMGAGIEAVRRVDGVASARSAGGERLPVALGC